MKEKTRIIILTYAYNCEKYVEETIQSVLNQTYDNYLWVLIENGSTDNTRSILRKYKDHPRVVYLESDYNSVLQPDKYNVTPWEELVCPKDDDYITTLDSDDYFEPDALETLIKAGDKHNADIVFAGCNMFRENNRDSVYVRKPAKSQFYQNVCEFAKDWHSSYGSIRVRWGNLYKYSNYVKTIAAIKEYKISNGIDTIQNLCALDCASTLTTVDKAVINYRIREHSAYTANIPPERYIAYDIIRDKSYALLDKWGCDDLLTYYFVEQVRESAMYDLVQSLAQSKVNPENNCKLLFNIFTDEGFSDSVEAFNMKSEFFVNTVKTVMENDEFLEEYRYENFVMMLIYGIAKSNMWLYLAGLYSEDNKCCWGSSLLIDMLQDANPWTGKIFENLNWNALFRHSKEDVTLALEENFAEIAKHLEAVNSGELEKYLKNEKPEREKILEYLRDSILKSLDAGQDSERYIQKALGFRLLDKEILKCIMLNDLNTANFSRLLDISVMVRFVYNNCPDMLYMASLGFEHLSMADNAIECLNLAIDCSKDKEQIATLKEEILRLERC